MALQYPPKSLTSLRSLHTSITTSAHLDTLRKHTLLYYLLLDLPASAAATAFGTRSLLPQSFIDLITAVHDLDNVSLQSALTHLTAPAVTPPVPEKILKTLYTHGSARMAIAFISCVQPVLESPEAIEIYFTAQMQLSPEAAFLYARTAPGFLRTQFLRKLVNYCITTNPAVNALKLLNMPFSEEEKTVFVDALKGNDYEVAKDTLVVWQMHQGRVEDALKSTQQVALKGQAGGLDWKVLGEGLKKGLGTRSIDV